MSTYLHLLSTAQNSWSRFERLLGMRDISLSEKGRVQTIGLVDQLQDVPLGGIYCARTTSANQTAAIIQGQLCKAELDAALKLSKLQQPNLMVRGAYFSLNKRNLLAHIKIHKDARLNNINYGALQGLYPEEIENRFSAVWSTYLTDPANAVFPGGESVHAVIQRLQSFLVSLQRNELYDHHALVISHFTIIQLLICLVKDIDIRLMHQIPYSEGQLSVVQYQ